MTRISAADRMLIRMRALSNDGKPCTREEIAAAIGISKQRAGVLLRYAREAGWVKRGERSGRHRCHVLTAQGQRRIDELGGRQ